MARTIRNVVSSVSVASLIFGSLIVALPAGANQYDSFRDFKAANPGLSNGALRHLYRESTGGGGGISIGTAPARTLHIQPIIENPVTFKEFKANNPGIGHGAAWRMYHHQKNHPGALSVQPIFNRPPEFNRPVVRPQTTPDPGSGPALSFQQFKDLNQGISQRTLKALYKAYKNGDRGITIGVIPPSGATGPSGPIISPPGHEPFPGNILHTPMPVKLVTGGDAL